MVSEMPLAYDAGSVALLLEQLGKRNFARMQPRVRVRKKDAAPKTHPHRMAPREQRRPRRSADRRGDVEICEARPFTGHAVEVRRTKLRRPIDADVAIALIVGKDDDDVGRSRGARRQYEPKENGYP